MLDDAGDVRLLVRHSADAQGAARVLEVVVAQVFVVQHAEGDGRSRRRRVKRGALVRVLAVAQDAQAVEAHVNTAVQLNGGRIGTLALFLLSSACGVEVILNRLVVFAAICKRLQGVLAAKLKGNLAVRVFPCLREVLVVVGVNQHDHMREILRGCAHQRDSADVYKLARVFHFRARLHLVNEGVEVYDDNIKRRDADVVQRLFVLIVLAVGEQPGIQAVMQRFYAAVKDFLGAGKVLNRLGGDFLLLEFGKRAARGEDCDAFGR